MEKIISFINLKGGVGKTTLLVATAEILAQQYNKKVLVIDLDPQTNATVSLISQDEWKEINENNRTIHQLFDDRINGRDAFDINKCIIRGVSNIGKGITNLDLLPSSIDLVDIYDEVSAANKDNRLINIIKDELKKIDKQYDYVLVDCPPNLGTITMCGIYISNYYIIPVIADTLSTYGLNQVVTKINKKTREIKRIDDAYSIEPLGIVINRYRNNKPYTTILNSLKFRSNNNKIPRLFNTIIYNRSAMSSISNYEESNTTIKNKYKELFNDMDTFVNEIMERC